ncbi:SdrD B-like domain-containing protein, partial [Spirosoma arcticum]
ISVSLCVGVPLNLTSLLGSVPGNVLTGLTTTLLGGGAVPTNLSVVAGLNAFNLVSTNPLGCSATTTISVTGVNAPVLPPLGLSLCVGTSVSLSSLTGPGGSLSILSGLTNVFSLSGTVLTDPLSVSAGVSLFDVTSTNPLGCSATTTISVTGVTVPGISPLSPISLSLCAGTTLDLTSLTILSGLTNVFSLSGTVINAPVLVSAGVSVFDVVSTNPAGCSATTTIIVTGTGLSLTVTPGACNTATNEFTLTGTVSLTNSPAASLTITDGTATVTVSVSAGQSSATFSLSGLLSGTGAHTVTVASTGICSTGASTTYAAPISCTSTASLGNLVFADNNQNGVQDAGDTPISSVTVTLVSNGTVVATTTTDVAGLYSFTGLTPGVPYSVSFTAPANYSASTPNVGGDDAIDSDPVAGITAPVTLTSGENNTSIDAGFILLTASLGDRVFVDANRDGQQGPVAQEPGIFNVTVSLFSNGTLVASTTTDVNGLYSFTGLTPGVPYSVSFTAPAGFSATLQNMGADATDSDGDPATGLTGTYSLTANENNLTVDQGYYQPASLGNSVFADNNQNGVQDAGDTPISSVTVTLVSNGTVVATTTTDIAGMYSFTGLTPGVPYSVSFTAPTNYSATVPNVGVDDAIDSDPVGGGITAPVTLTSGENNTSVDAGFILLTASLGDRVFVDANRDGQQGSPTAEPGIPGVVVVLLDGTLTPVASTTTDASGLYSFTGLTPGVPYSVSFTTPAGFSATLQNVGADAIDSDGDPVTGLTGTYSLTANENNSTVDQGYYQTASLGNMVFADNNNNGVQDGGDTPISSVTVTLVSNGTVVATTVTNVAGMYSFTGLTPGVPYSVSFTTPANFTASAPNVGGDDELDSDPVGGITTPVTLTSGQNDTSVDAGFSPPTGSIGDMVFNDLDRDGRRDPGEPGVSGVTVRLLQETTPGNYTVVSVTLTTGNGGYLFPNLPAGNYIVEFDGTNLPAGFTFTQSPNAPGVPDDLDSDADPVTGRTGVITIVLTDPAQRNITAVDAGLVTDCPPAKCVPFVITRTR